MEKIQSLTIREGHSQEVTQSQKKHYMKGPLSAPKIRGSLKLELLAEPEGNLPCLFPIRNAL